MPTLLPTASLTLPLSFLGLVVDLVFLRHGDLRVRGAAFCTPRHPPERLETKADLAIAQEDGGWRITAVTLNLKAKVPGISRDEFMKLAEAAKAGCPVSKVLNAEITLKAELE